MQRPIARVEVSPEFLLKALHFPEDTTLIGAKVERGTHGYVLTLLLEHDDLPMVDEAEVAPVIVPVVTYHRESWDFDWNADTEHDLVMDDYPDPLEMNDWDNG